MHKDDEEIADLQDYVMRVDRSFKPPVYEVFAEYTRGAEYIDDFDSLHEARLCVARLMKRDFTRKVLKELDDYQHCKGAYEGEGTCCRPHLAVFRHDEPAEIDEEATAKNVEAFMKVLRYAALEVKCWQVVDAMMYPTPYGYDDELVYSVMKMKEAEDMLETLEKEEKNEGHEDEGPLKAPEPPEVSAPDEGVGAGGEERAERD